MPDNELQPESNPPGDAAADPMFDPDGALSRAFLLARGSCCGYGCKNCPYYDQQPRP